VNSGFKGSAIISAVFWEHDMFDDEGIFVRNLLGLAAVVVERTATRLGEDIPGDEAAGTAGIPFLQTDEDDFEYFFDFEGPVAPLCPGVGFRQPPGSCPETFVAQCEDCPFAIPDVTTVSSTIDINASDIPSGCSIEDVDVLLDFNHTFNADLTLDLSSPDLADVQLFSAICGATDGMHAILDDEAQQPIGSVCPPVNFLRYNTETPGNLTQFEGTQSNGAWRLDVADLVGGDSGTMLNWELQFRLGN
jgi:subtilisin-like proprotein convertase family protein